MSDLRSRLERLTSSIHRNGYSDTCITEAVDEIERLGSTITTQCQQLRQLAGAVESCYEYVDDDKTPAHVDRELAAALVVSRSILEGV